MKLKISVSINSGAALILFVVSFFGLVLLAAGSDKVVSIFAVALTGLTAAFSGYLLKRNANNKIGLEAKRVEITNGKTGDPLS